MLTLKPLLRQIYYSRIIDHRALFKAAQSLKNNLLNCTQPPLPFSLLAFPLLCTHRLLHGTNQTNSWCWILFIWVKRVAFGASSDFNFVLREFVVSRIPSIVVQSKIMQSETISLERCNLKYLFWEQCWGTMPAKETSLMPLSHSLLSVWLEEGWPGGKNLGRFATTKPKQHFFGFIVKQN